MVMKKIGNPVVVFVGRLPPPVTGEAITTRFLLEHLRRRGIRLMVVNGSPGRLNVDTLGHLRKIGAFVYSALLIIGVGLRRQASVYITVGANKGMVYSAILAALGRIVTGQVFLHHHSYSYVAAPAIRMKFLCLCAGRKATHIVICDQMSSTMKANYARVCRTISLSNASAVSQGDRPNTVSTIFNIGHLSNLSMDKGLHIVIDVLRQLLQRGVDARLILAGPMASQRARQMVERARLEFGDRLEYRGFVSGDAKKRFYRDISVFLFPTMYPNETQGIVNLEALSMGRPVIAFGRCCIPEDIGEAGGMVVPVGRNFAEMALPQLMEWSSDRECLSTASLSAFRRFDLLRERALDQLEAFCEMIGK